MAFTISNIESIREANLQNARQLDGDDWKTLIDQNTKKDEISMTKEFMRDRKKKEDYRQVLDMQTKYLNHLKQSHRKHAEESNVAERLWLRNQYNQETDTRIGNRLKSMECQKQINDQNKYFNDLRNRQKSLNKQAEGLSYKENPIEMRLRMDQMKKLEQNKVREKDILQYNNNAVKMLKMRQQNHKDKEKYFSEQFNSFVENQAVSHIINRTSQQEKYETKRQMRDFMVLKDRTLAVKKTIDDLIFKYTEMDKSHSTNMKELLDMQTTIK